VLSLSKKLNKFGIHYVEAIRPEECIGCCRCAEICPDAAIEVEKEISGPDA